MSRGNVVAQGLWQQQGTRQGEEEEEGEDWACRL